MSHREECQKVAQDYDWLLSVIFARDHLEALLRARPDLEPELDPVIARLNEMILGADL